VQLLRVPNVIVAVNKIDLQGYDAEAYATVAAEVLEVTRELGLPGVHVIPVSALEGDNVVDRSPNTPWYDGPALLELLETLPTVDEIESSLEAFRLDVQLVLRPQGALAPAVAAQPDAADRFRDYRAFAGQVSSGTVRVGDEVAVFPGGAVTTVVGIDTAGGELDEAHAPQSVALRLAHEIDAARGAVIAASGTLPEGRREIAAELFQLDARPLAPGARVLVKFGTATVQALVASVEGRRNLDTLATEAAEQLEANDIGRVTLRLSAELPFEDYAVHRRSGAFLVIHPQDGATLAAGTHSPARAAAA